MQIQCQSANWAIKSNKAPIQINSNYTMIALVILIHASKALTAITLQRPTHNISQYEINLLFRIYLIQNFQIMKYSKFLAET